MAEIQLLFVESSLVSQNGKVGGYVQNSVFNCKNLITVTRFCYGGSYFKTTIILQ